MRKKQYIRCKESRSYVSYGPWVLKPKSNTKVVIDNMMKGRPMSGYRVEKYDGTIVVRREKKNNGR